MKTAPNRLGSKTLSVLSQFRIVFVDDDQDWIVLLKNELSEIGIEIESNNILITQETGLVEDFVKASQSVVVIADHNMDKPGVKLIEWLVESYPDVKIFPFIYTAGFDKYTFQALIEAHSIEVILKSDGPLTLMKKVMFRISPHKKVWHQNDEILLREILTKLRSDLIDDLKLIRADDSSSTFFFDGVEYTIDDIIYGLVEGNDLGVRYLTRYWKGVNNLNKRLYRK